MDLLIVIAILSATLGCFFEEVWLFLAMTIAAGLILRSFKGAVGWTALFIMCVGFGILYGGWFHFEVYDEMRLRSESDPWTLFSQFHPHSLRFLLFYPVFVFSRFSTIDYDYVYGVVSIFMLTLQIVLLARFSVIHRSDYKGHVERIEVQSMLLAAALFLGIGLFMNGRLIPAYLGSALILWVQAVLIAGRLRLGAKAALLQFIGILLASVSSGTMIVAFMQVVLGMIWIARKESNKKWYLASMGALAFIFLILAPFVALLIKKNIDFFGGGLDGIIGMLSHGFGAILYNLEPALFLSITSLVFIFIFWRFRSWFIENHEPLLPAILAIVIAMVLGTFGYSTLSMGLPAIVALISIFVFQRDCFLGGAVSGRCDVATSAAVHPEEHPKCRESTSDQHVE